MVFFFSRKKTLQCTRLDFIFLVNLFLEIGRKPSTNMCSCILLSSSGRSKFSLLKTFADSGPLASEPSQRTNSPYIVHLPPLIFLLLPLSSFFPHAEAPLTATPTPTALLPPQLTPLPPVPRPPTELPPLRSAATSPATNRPRLLHWPFEPLRHPPPPPQT